MTTFDLFFVLTTDLNQKLQNKSAENEWFQTLKESWTPEKRWARVVNINMINYIYSYIFQFTNELAS